MLRGWFLPPPPVPTTVTLSINRGDVKSLSIEMLLHKKRNTLLNALYGSSKGVIEPFERFLNEILKKTKNQFGTFPYYW